jgi:phosphoserine phosphatase RsbX
MWPDEVDVAVASHPMPGQVESGDASLALAGSDRLLLLVVDGLGHGPEAAAAAQRALVAAERHANEPLDAIFRHCHAALLGSRGVAMSAAILRPALGRLTWAGVGNVEGILVIADARPSLTRPRQSLINRGGVVGYQLPDVRVTSLECRPSSCLVLATDGLDHRFVDDIVPGAPSQAIADRALDRHWRRDDDGLVLVAQLRPAG